MRVGATRQPPAVVAGGCCICERRRCSVAAMTVSNIVGPLGSGWVTVTDAAALVGQDRSAVYRWVRAGQVDSQTVEGLLWLEVESVRTRAAWPHRRGPRPRPHKCPSCGHDLRRDLAPATDEATRG